MLKAFFPWKRNNFNKTKVIAAMDMTNDGLTNGWGPLLPCHVCQRTFHPDALKKHAKICENVARKKRKVFNSLKQRVSGTDIAPFLDPARKKEQNLLDEKSAGQWRQKHAALLSTIKESRRSTVTMRDSPSSAQPTPTKRLQSASTSSLKSVPQLNQHERCPSCDRHFGPKAYDRHVEWCRERKARIQLTPANQAAKERLQARIKYQVPALKKSPLTIVREKYSQKSPLLGRSDMDVKSGPNNAKVVQKGKSFTSVDKSDREEIPFSRSQARMERIGDYGQDIKETKLDNRSKTPISTLSNNEPSLDEFVIALEDPSYFKSTPLNYYMEEYKSINSPVKEIKSDCLPLKEENSLTKVPIDILDLDSTKGFELLESIVNENTNKNFIIDSLNNQIFIKTNGTDDDLHKRKYSDEMSPIDPRLINKIDNLIVPSNLNDLSPTSTIDSGKTVRSVSVERNKIDKTPKLKRNGSITVRNLKKDFANNVQNQKAKPAVSSLIKPKVVSRQNSTETRSVKAVPSKIKSTIPTLSKDGQKNNEKKKSAEVDNCNINELNAEELFPEDNKMYEEYKKYEEMYLEERQKKSASRKHVPKPVDFGINLETFDGNTSAKPGYDSAYGSLKIAPKELENLSNLAQPKFCHECGTKYPVPSARFCIECGVKRLIL